MRRLSAFLLLWLSLAGAATADELPLAGAYALRYPGQKSEAIDVNRCLFGFSLFERGGISAYLLDLEAFARDGKPVFRRYPARYACDYTPMPQLARAGAMGLMACTVTPANCDPANAACTAERSHQVVRRAGGDDLRMIFVAQADYETIKSYAGKELPRSLHAPSTGYVMYQKCSVPIDTLKRFIDGSSVDDESFSRMAQQTRYWNNVQSDAQRSAAEVALPKLIEKLR